jgi:hypothetical protein
VTLQTRQHEPPDDHHSDDHNNKDDHNKDGKDGEYGRTMARLGTLAKGRHRRARRTRLGFPRVAERVLGGWAPTLRMAAILLLALTVGLTVVVAAWGVVGIACVVLLCAVLHRVINRLDRRLVI